MTPEIKARFKFGGLDPVCFYWNASIPAEVVLTVKQSDKAFLADTPAMAITKAEYEIYRGL